MPKNNEITKRVFTDLAKRPDQEGAHEHFLKVDEDLGLPIPEELREMKTRYSLIAKDFVDDLAVLASIEEIIIQMRCKLVIESELRLSLSRTSSRSYVYARSLFYRRGKDINDIRVLMGKAEDLGSDLGSLLNNEEFIQQCHTRLLEAMDNEIKNNIDYLNKVVMYE